MLITLVLFLQNTALMKVYCDGQVYEVRIESDEKKKWCNSFYAQLIYSA